MSGVGHESTPPVGARTAAAASVPGYATGGNIPACGYCGAWHSGTCPRIKSIDYYPNGSVKHVEFHDANAVLRDPQGWPIIAPTKAQP